MPKPRVHREWFRTVERGGRKSCPSCRAKLEPGEWIWSWGEYVRAKFRCIRDVCKNCWPEVQKRLKDHAGDCGCVFELEARGASRPAWMTMECNTVPIDPNKTVTVGQLIGLAGRLNEEAHLGNNPEYTRGQVNLIGDAAGLTVEEQPEVETLIKAAAKEFYAPAAP